MLGALYDKPRPSLIIVLALCVGTPGLAAAQEDESEEGERDEVGPEEDPPEDEDARDQAAADKAPPKAPPKTAVAKKAPEAPARDQAARDTADGRVFLGSRASRQTVPRTTAPVSVTTSDNLTFFHGPSLLSPAKLRGLGPDRVLVLVNGKRRHQMAEINLDEEVGKGSSGTDLNAIPIGAIERVEILRDSAAALYGPNAVGGVINIVLKERRGLELETMGGSYFQGDGNALLGLDTFRASVNGGMDLGRDGFLNLTLEFRDRGETNRAGIATLESDQDGFLPRFGSQWWAADASCPPDPFEPDVVPPCKPVRRLRFGNQDGQDYYAFYNGGYDLSDRVSVYSHGGVSRRIGNAGAGLYLGVGSGRTPAELYPDGYLPNLQTTVDDLSMTGGIRVALGGPWELDTSVTYGRNKFDYLVSNTANLSLFYEKIDPTDPSPTAPRYYQTPTSANAGQLINTEITFNVDLSTTLFDELELGYGLEFRVDNYQIVPGEYASWGYARNTPFDPNNPIYNQSSQPLQEAVNGGTQGFPGFGPDSEVDGDRLAWGAYMDAQQPVFDWWTLGATGRFETVEYTGNAYLGRIATRFDVTDFLSLRGSASNGSRSPDIQKIYYSKRLTAVLPQGLTETITAGDAHPLRGEFGMSQLRPEKSTSFSGGVVVAPSLGGMTRSLTLTVDAYQVDIKDRILLSESVTGDVPSVPPGLMDTPGRQQFRQTLADNNLGAAQFFINAADTTTRGLDVEGAWGLGLTGKLGLNLGAALYYSQTRILASNPRAALVTSDDLFSPILQTRLQRGEPRYTATLSEVTSYDPVAVGVAFRYFGPVTGKAYMDFEDEKTWSGKWLTDASASVAVLPELTLTAGAQNVFNVYPDKWGSVGNEYPEIGYTYGLETLPFGVNGRFVYLGAKLTPL